MTGTPLRTPLEMLYQWETRKPDAVYLRQPIARQRTTYTWGQVADQVRRMANVLADIGPRGTSVGILSANCAHWFMADLAVMMSGHVSVPLFTTMGGDAARYVFDHSNVRVLLVGHSDNWDRIRDCIPTSVKLITFPGVNIEGAEPWDALTATREPLPGNPVRGPDELCTIIYTSGTTGLSKGVAHSSRTLGAAATSFITACRVNEKDRFFSYLPLAHCAERIAVLLASLYCGASVSFNESPATFGDDLQQARPTLFFAVPRIWRKFQLAIQDEFGAERLAQLLSAPTTAEPTGLKVRRMLGLDAVKVAVTGAAPTPMPLHAWYESIGLLLNEFYGQTELLPISCNLPWDRRPGTIGKALPGIEIRIADSGEILVSGSGHMQGYYRDPERTAQVLSDGWIHTGDCGKLDGEGFLKLTGRLKDIFKTSTGKYVAPLPIESRFADDIYVEQVCLVGAGLPETILMAVLSEAGKTTDRAVVNAALRRRLAQVNARVEHHERISHIMLSGEPWSIENGLLTHTLKIKRHAVEAKFMEELSELSDNRAAKTDPIIWHCAPCNLQC
jgi:long-chain acyl-CoA synthetase